MKKNSCLGFVGSLVFHSILAILLFWGFRQENSASSSQADVFDTSISMQMMLATVIEQPQPVEVEPTPVEIEPENKEIVSDPTIKEEIEKPKEQPPEKKEKPKEKPKKEQPKKQPPKKVEKPKEAAKAERNVDSINQINSQAAGLARSIDSPNLAGTGSSTSEISAYQSALRREIERNKKYSQRAQMMRKQGTVIVAFRLSAEGVITNARITQSSGIEELDNSALSAVQKARSVGIPPVSMSLDFSVPIQFRIR